MARRHRPPCPHGRAPRGRHPPRRRLVRHRGQPRRARDVGRARRADRVHAHRRGARPRRVRPHRPRRTPPARPAELGAPVPGRRARVRPRSIRRCVPSTPTASNLPLRAEQLHRTRARAGRRRRRVCASPAWSRSWVSAASARPASRSRSAAELLPSTDDGVWFVRARDRARSRRPARRDRRRAAVHTAARASRSAIGLQQFLEHKRLLLVLDNCEHLVGAVAAFVSETTTHAPGVSVLATSREALGVRGEHIYAAGLARRCRRTPIRTRCSRPKPVRCSPPGPARRVAISCSTSATRSPSTRCARGSTASRSRSSSPPPRPR